MGTSYEVNAGLQKAIDALLEDISIAEFSPIREHQIKVLSCTKNKLNEEDEPVQTAGDTVQVKKVSDLHQAFIDGHYLVVMDGYVFDHVDDGQLQAILHSALMRIKVEPTESGVKLGTRKPDIQVFQATIHRFGAYTDDLLSLKECLFKSSKRFTAMITDAAPDGEEHQAEEPKAEEPPRIHAATPEEMGQPTPRPRTAKGK